MGEFFYVWEFTGEKTHFALFANSMFITLSFSAFLASCNGANELWDDSV